MLYILKNIVKTMTKLIAGNLPFMSNPRHPHRTHNSNGDTCVPKNILKKHLMK